MKDKIIEILNKEKRTFKELRSDLNIKNYSDSKKLNDFLKELLTEKKIYFRRKNETYNIKDQEEFIGTFVGTRREYGFVEKGDISVYIPEKFLLNAFHGDTVKVILFPLRDEDKPNRRAGKIVRIIQKNGSNIVGRIKIIDDKKTFIPDDIVSKWQYSIENINDFEEDEILLTKFEDFIDPKTVKLNFVKKLGKTSEAKLDAELIGYKFQLTTRFSKKSKSDVKNVKGDNSSSEKNRRDENDRLIFTIDGADSKDLDDAIDIKKDDKGNYELGVHIADVSHYVRENTSIDEEAKKRGTSVYLIDTVYPMLPEKLSNDLCSLNPDVEKLAFTCQMKIDSLGNVLEAKIYESKITSKHRLTYSEVDELLNGEVKTLRNEELTESLLIAKELADILRKAKIKNGMIDFDLSEIKIELDGDGNVRKMKNKIQTTSEKMIEDLMVITNETIANFFVDDNYPSIFRVHPKPLEENLIIFNNLTKSLNADFIDNENKLNEITSGKLMNFLEKNKDNVNSDILKRFMIQSMEKAMYSSENRGHYALGLKNYLHFTSPIRRYSDLIVHRLLKEFYLKNDEKDKEKNKKRIEDLKIKYKEILPKIAEHISESERIAISSERKLVDIKKARFMEDSIGKELEGKIVSVVKFGFFVEFENLTQGLVHIEKMNDDEYIFNEQKFELEGKNNKKQFKLGSEIKTRILSVDVIRGLIDLEVV